MIAHQLSDFKPTVAVTPQGTSLPMSVSVAVLVLARIFFVPPFLSQVGFVHLWCPAAFSLVAPWGLLPDSPYQPPGTEWAAWCRCGHQLDPCCSWVNAVFCRTHRHDHPRIARREEPKTLGLAPWRTPLPSPLRYIGSTAVADGKIGASVLPHEPERWTSTPESNPSFRIWNGSSPAEQNTIST